MSYLNDVIDVRRHEWTDVPKKSSEVGPDHFLSVEVHHGGSDLYSRDGFAALPAILAYHTHTQGYRDIWYHLGIDENGLIFELRGVDVKNSSIQRLTVLFIGGYNETPANQKQLDALRRIRLALILDGGGSHLSWHRQRAQTACPGNALVAQLEAVTDPPEPPSGDGPYVDAPPVAVLQHDLLPGYAIVGADGGVFTFGGFPFLGSASEHVEEGDRIVSAQVILIDDVPGYTFVSFRGAVFNFGSSTYQGRVWAGP